MKAVTATSVFTLAVVLQLITTTIAQNPGEPAPNEGATTTSAAEVPGATNPTDVAGGAKDPAPAAAGAPPAAQGIEDQPAAAQNSEAKRNAMGRAGALPIGDGSTSSSSSAGAKPTGSSSIKKSNNMYAKDPSPYSGNDYNDGLGLGSTNSKRVQQTSNNSYGKGSTSGAASDSLVSMAMLSAGVVTLTAVSMSW